MNDLIRDPIAARLHRMAQIAANTTDPAAGEALNAAIAAIRAVLDMPLPTAERFGLGDRESKIRRLAYDAARLDADALMFDALGLGSRPGGATVPGVGSSRDYDPPELVAELDRALGRTTGPQ